MSNQFEELIAFCANARADLITKFNLGMITDDELHRRSSYNHLFSLFKKDWDFQPKPR